MSTDHFLHQILAESIRAAQAKRYDPKGDAIDAAKAFKAGLAAVGSPASSAINPRVWFDEWLLSKATTLPLSPERARLQELARLIPQYQTEYSQLRQKILSEMRPDSDASQSATAPPSA